MNFLKALKIAFKENSLLEYDNEWAYCDTIDQSIYWECDATSWECGKTRELPILRVNKYGEYLKDRPQMISVDEYLTDKWKVTKKEMRVE